MIRPATLADIPAIVELGRKMHSESPIFRRLAYSPTKVATLCEQLIEFEEGFAWVGGTDQTLYGGMLGHIGPPWMSDEPVANELALFVEKTARGALLASRLLRVFVSWSKIEGARLVIVGASTGVEPERTAQFYERFGFTRSTSVCLERVM